MLRKLGILSRLVWCVIPNFVIMRNLHTRNDIRRRTNNDKVNNISLGAVYLDTRVSNVAYNLRFHEYI